MRRIAVLQRRLPVYLVLDCSASMEGESIEAVRQGIKALVFELAQDPQAAQTAWLSVLIFSSTAGQASPLTPLSRFKEPIIKAGGTTALGSALTLLKQCIQSDLHPKTEDFKGDWKPLVFLLTDGGPTDDWQLPAKELRKAGIANLVVCASGSDASMEVAQALTDAVLTMNTLTSGDIAEHFSWVDANPLLTSNV